jgi:membrane protein
LADSGARVEGHSVAYVPAIGEDRLLAVAAGVVFYGLLALFPAVTALVSFYGLFANASAINDHLSSLGGILPSSAVDILHEQIA